MAYSVRDSRPGAGEALRIDLATSRAAVIGTPSPQPPAPPPPRRPRPEPPRRWLWWGLGLVALAIGAAFAAGCGGAASTPTTPTPTSSTPPTTPGRHEVTIAADGATIGGILYRPDTSAGARPAVIVIHGWLAAGSNGAALVESRARRFSEDGYVAIAISMRGWPPSSGADDCGLRQPDDVVAVAQWLRTMPGVAPDRVGLIGFSQGGQVALLAGARDSRLGAVVAYFPVTDVARWKTTTANTDIPQYITQVCEPGGTEPRSPVARAAAIVPPVLLVHGDADTRVPTEQSVRLASALADAGRRAELFLVPGAQHGFTAAEEALARPVADAFLASRLR